MYIYFARVRLKVCYEKFIIKLCERVINFEAIKL